MPYIFLDETAAILFVLALVHTFCTRKFEQLAHRFPRHGGLFHLLGEVEVVFGFWAIVLIVVMAAMGGTAQAVAYAESRQFTEPLFVFVVMVMAASRPILEVVQNMVQGISKALPGPNHLTQAWLGLCAIPLLGSLITEPAAMTVAALMLAPRVFRHDVPEHLKYMALGVLFVNISIGGTLTSFAAPPVLMVAGTWGWDSLFMLQMFGWKAAIAVVINASVAVYLLRSHLLKETTKQSPTPSPQLPWPVIAVHICFLASVIFWAHHPVIFIGLFLLFLGFTQAYAQHQSPLIIKEALLVAFFLAGLVVLGGMQSWWLQPLVANMDPHVLFWGAAGLTAITDNAALTYLGSLINGLSEQARYSLVAGAVAGGGLTIIANAPNPAGVAILRRGFTDQSISAVGLLCGAIAPTAVALCALGLF